MPVSKELRIGPLRHLMSINPIIRRFTKLLPNASPAAKSGNPITVTELRPVANSGREVADARSKTPIKVRPSPVLIAITSVDFARKLDTAKISVVATRNCIHIKGNDKMPPKRRDIKVQGFRIIL